MSIIASGVTENWYSEIITVFYQGGGYNKTLCDVKFLKFFISFFVFY